MSVKHVLAAVALGGALLAGGVAQASVVGSTITCSTNQPTILVCDPTTFTITDSPFDPNPDVVLESAFDGNEFLLIDFMGGWVDIFLPPLVTQQQFLTSTLLTLSGFNDPTGSALTLRSLSITNVSGLTPSDFNLSGGTLTIDITNTTWTTGANVGFDVAVPLPASALLLLGGLAGLGLAARRRRPA